MWLINLTPHDINFYDEEGSELLFTVPPSGIVTRRTVTEEIVDYVDEIPVVRQMFGEVQDLPEPEYDTIYIVSAITAKGLDRDDVFVPSRPVRDPDGRVIGCRALGRVD